MQYMDNPGIASIRSTLMGKMKEDLRLDMNDVNVLRKDGGMYLEPSESVMVNRLFWNPF